jgi:hypothetical protein
MSGMRNITRLLTERNPWDYFNVGVPYPTGFHPRPNSNVIEWQRFVHERNRTSLFSLARATHGAVRNDFKGLLQINDVRLLRFPTHDLGHELVRLVPRRDQLPQHDTGEPGGALAESIVQLNVFDTLATQNNVVLVKGETLNINQNGAVLANVFIYIYIFH